MKLFNLCWLVTEGRTQYFESELYAIKDEMSAEAFGISFEYEQNVGTKPEGVLSQKDREDARLQGIKARGKCYEFHNANEVTIVESPNCQLYEVKIQINPEPLS